MIRLLNRRFLSHHQRTEDVYGLMSGMCPQISIDMPRSDARIGSGCQKQEVSFVIVNPRIVNKGILFIRGPTNESW